jgi:MtN3 and saliva related transmembrane protein
MPYSTRNHLGFLVTSCCANNKRGLSSRHDLPTLCKCIPNRIQRDKRVHYWYHPGHTGHRANQLETLDILGLVATAFTTSSFIPQVWTTWRTKDVSGISLPTYIIITIGLFLWLLYGAFKGDMPLIVANAVMVVLTSAITVMKLRYGREPK